MSSATCERLVLASSSPFRRALLKATGLPFAVLPPTGVDESRVLADDPRGLAMARALAKGLAVAAHAPGSLVIGADQVLATEGGQTFDKAKSVAEAELRLGELQGRTHYLHSAFVLAFCPTGKGGVAQILAKQVVDAPMSMRPLTASEIKAYVATGEWRGAVGCYQYENRGVHLFNGAAPDHSTIIGLPMLPLLGELRRLGINPLTSPTAPWTISL